MENLDRRKFIGALGLVAGIPGIAGASQDVEPKDRPGAVCFDKVWKSLITIRNDQIRTRGIVFSGGDQLALTGVLTDFSECGQDVMPYIIALQPFRRLGGGRTIEEATESILDVIAGEFHEHMAYRKSARITSPELLTRYNRWYPRWAHEKAVNHG